METRGAGAGKARLYELFDTDPAPLVDFLRWLAAEHGLDEPIRGLDVGCGPGRLLGALGRLEWSVLGLEPDPDFFERARERARSFEGVRVEQGGFADVESTGDVDLAAAMNGPFSYLLTPEAREEAASRLHGALAPGGLVVVDMANFPWILKNYRPPEPATASLDGRTIRRTPVHSLDFHACHWTHTDRFEIESPDGRTETLEVEHRMAMVGYPEVARVLDAAGFADVRTYDGYDARESGRLTGSRLLVSARKPD